MQRALHECTLATLTVELALRDLWPSATLTVELALRDLWPSASDERHKCLDHAAARMIAPLEGVRNK
jgi:hypothetical protein